MHKCFRCGTEFEGSFCPECGTRWQEEKHCPNCGAMLAGSTKFCNNCGYSFVESAEAKPKKEKKPSKIGAFFCKVWAWIRAHLKIVIPTAIALVAVIVLLSLIPTFIVMSVNGTYYAYSLGEDEELVFSEDSFITLSTGKWKDEGGNEGKYKLSGSEITLIYEDKAAKELGDILGDLGGVQTTVEMKGTVKNGVLTVLDGKRERVFAKKNHKHKFNKGNCACGFAPLKYSLTKDGAGYIVSGITGKEKDNIDSLKILSEYKGKPVVGIGDSAFEYCEKLTSITIPNSVTSIGDDAFECCKKLTSITIPDSVTSIGGGAFWGCSSLTSIIFNGTKAEWNAIEKGWGWNIITPNFTIQCTDGKLDKDGNEIE